MISIVLEYPASLLLLMLLLLFWGEGSMWRRVHKVGGSSNLLRWLQTIKTRVLYIHSNPQWSWSPSLWLCSRAGLGGDVKGTHEAGLRMHWILRLLSGMMSASLLWSVQNGPNHGDDGTTMVADDHQASRLKQRHHGQAMSRCSPAGEPRKNQHWSSSLHLPVRPHPPPLTVNPRCPVSRDGVFSRSGHKVVEFPDILEILESRNRNQTHRCFRGL